MAITVKNVVRSILESMLFLAVLGGSVSLLSVFMNYSGRHYGVSLYITYPVLCCVASLVVGFAFPKPTFWRAFWKLFAGGLLTFAIVVGLSLILGPAVFTFVLDVLWGIGGHVWDWSSADSIILGIFAVIFYILLTILVVGIIMAALFAVTNFFVLLVMNMVIERRQVQEAEVGNNDRQLPFS